MHIDDEYSLCTPSFSIRYFSKPFGRTCIVFAFIAIVTALTYYGAASNEFVFFDDSYLVFENTLIRTISWSNAWKMFTQFDPELYVPLTVFSFQIDYFLGGNAPFMFHLTNIILHGFNGMLVYVLLFLLYKKHWLALMLATLFVVHPLHTEAVAWVSARKDLLSASLFFLSLLTYILYRSQNRPLLRTISIVCFALGLLSKVSIALLPILLFLYEWRLGRDLRSGKLWISIIPYALLSLLFIVVAFVGKQEVLSELSVIEGLLIAAKSTVFYLQKFLLPTNLSVLYPYTKSVTITAADFWIPVLCIGVLVPGVIATLKYTKEITFGFGMFLIMLIPSFFNFTRASDIYFASDRYAYIPIFGLLCVLAYVLKRMRMRFVAPALIIGIAACVILTHIQVAVWRTTETLFQQAIDVYPNAHVAFNKVGAAHMDRGETDTAIEHYQDSIAIRPNKRAYYNLGAAYITKNAMNKAYEVTIKALEEDGQYEPALTNMGYLEWKKGNTAEAIDYLLLATQQYPFALTAHINLAVIYLQSGKVSEARAIVEHVLRIDPQNKEALELLKLLEKE